MENNNFIQRMKMDIDTLSDYYIEKRLEGYESNIPLKEIDLRKKYMAFHLNWLSWIEKHQKNYYCYK